MRHTLQSRIIELYPLKDVNLMHQLVSGYFNLSFFHTLSLSSHPHRHRRTHLPFKIHHENLYIQYQHGSLHFINVKHKTHSIIDGNDSFRTSVAQVIIKFFNISILNEDRTLKMHL